MLRRGDDLPRVDICGDSYSVVNRNLPSRMRFGSNLSISSISNRNMRRSRKDRSTLSPPPLWNAKMSTQDIKTMKRSKILNFSSKKFLRNTCESEPKI
eukprot:gene3425-biopygen12030